MTWTDRRDKFDRNGTSTTNKQIVTSQVVACFPPFCFCSQYNKMSSEQHRVCSDGIGCPFTFNTMPLAQAPRGFYYVTNGKHDGKIWSDLEYLLSPFWVMGEKWGGDGGRWRGGRIWSIVESRKGNKQRWKELGLCVPFSCSLAALTLIGPCDKAQWCLSCFGKKGCYLPLIPPWNTAIT